MESPQHDSNLCDTEGIVDQTLREALHHAGSYRLSCQACMGKAVWLGDFIDHSMTHGRRLQLYEFEKPQEFLNGRPHLKNAFFTRYGGV